MRKVIAGIGYILIALIVAGVCLDVLFGLRNRLPFYGVNYWGQPLGTYSMLLVLVMAGIIGVVRLVQLASARRHRDQGKR